MTDPMSEPSKLAKISKVQFGGLAREMVNFSNVHPKTGATLDAGFSVRNRVDEKGDLIHAKDAYMVGGQAPERLTGNPPQAHEIEDYANEHEALLDSDPRLHIGAWNPVDPDLSPPALDVAKSHDRNLEGFISSHELAQKTNEHGIGEVDEEGLYVNYHPTIRNTNLRQGVYYSMGNGGF